MPEQYELWKKLGLLSSIGLTLVACTFLGFWLGYYLDRKLGTQPWLTIIFLLLGTVAGFVNFFNKCYVTKGPEK